MCGENDSNPMAVVPSHQRKQLLLKREVAACDGARSSLKHINELKELDGESFHKIEMKLLILILFDVSLLHSMFCVGKIQDLLNLTAEDVIKLFSQITLPHGDPAAEVAYDFL